MDAIERQSQDFTVTIEPGLNEASGSSHEQERNPAWSASARSAPG
jgi:hypothetical protein